MCVCIECIEKRVYLVSGAQNDERSLEGGVCKNVQANSYTETITTSLGNLYKLEVVT